MPCAANSAFASASSPALRAEMAMRAPISASPFAICSPRPREPPVTRATLPPSSNSSRTPTSAHLEQAGGALAAADAHVDHHQPRAAAPAFDERVSRQARAADAIRMTDRDGAAVDVELLM